MSKRGLEFLDIIWTGSAYIKRYRNWFSGKYEIVEVPSSYEAYKLFNQPTP